MRTHLRSLRIVLQAGGKGDRLRDGRDLPKPLFTVGGVPLVVRLLRQFAGQGARTFTVITGFGAERIEAALRDLRGLPGGVETAFLRETCPRGNAGSLARVPRDRACLLCFADLATDIDAERLAALHAGRGAAVTLASHYENLQVRLGELTVDGDIVLAYREKPVHRVLISSGIAVLEPAVLELVPRDRPAGLSDLVRSAIESGRLVTHWLHGARWIDVNTPQDLAAANRLFAPAQVE